MTAININKLFSFIPFVKHKKTQYISVKESKYYSFLTIKHSKTHIVK
jgi:hypothetical protein